MVLKFVLSCSFFLSLSVYICSFAGRAFPSRFKMKPRKSIYIYTLVVFFVLLNPKLMPVLISMPMLSPESVGAPTLFFSFLFWSVILFSLIFAICGNVSARARLLVVSYFIRFQFVLFGSLLLLVFTWFYFIHLHNTYCRIIYANYCVYVACRFVCKLVYFVWMFWSFQFISVVVVI